MGGGKPNTIRYEESVFSHPPCSSLFVLLYLYPAPQDVGDRSRGVKALITVPRDQSGRVYAGFWIWTSENFTSRT